MISVVSITSLLPGLPAPPIDFIRYKEDTRQISIIDVVRVLSGKASRHAGEQINGILQGEEVAGRVGHFKFPGQGQRETPVCDAETMTQIIMVLPGRWAAQVRAAFAKIICAAMAGDVVQRMDVVAPEERNFWSGTVASSAKDMLEWREDRNSSKQSHNAKIDALRHHAHFKASRWDLIKSAASTSRAVIGQFPKDFKSEMGLAPNCSARDYMTREQLVTVTMIDSHMNEWLRSNPSCTREEMRQHHDAVSQSFFVALQISGQHERHLTIVQGRAMKKKLASLERTVARIDAGKPPVSALEPRPQPLFMFNALPQRKHANSILMCMQ